MMHPSPEKEGCHPRRRFHSREVSSSFSMTWFWQQFSGQLGDDDDPADLEFGAAVAAAALAILSAEEEDKVFTNRTKPVEELQRSLTRTRSRREESISKSTDGGKISRWISGEDGKEDGRLAVSGDSFKRKRSTLDERMREKSAADLKIQEKAMDSTTGTKRTPSFSNKYLNERRSKHSDYGGDNSTAQGVPPSMNGRRIEKNKADAWEQETMEKIRKRYEKMNNTILQWENEKKVKAKRRKERKERALEMRRARILQEFRDEIIRIDMIASGARAVADDTRRNDELKAKENAKKMRATGKAPRKCFCF